MGLINKKSNESSLKWSMMRTLILCWVIPLSLLTIIVLKFVYYNLNEQTKQSIKNSADKAVEICLSRMQDSITASKNASYLPTIREKYIRYQRDQNKLQLYETVTAFLTEQYKFDDRFLSTMLIFTGSPETIYYTYSNKYKSTYSNVQYFKNHAQSQVLEISKQLDTSVEFLPVDDRVYMIRNLVTPSYEPYAIIIMELNNLAVFDSLRTIWGYENGSIFINGKSLCGTLKNNIPIPFDVITDESVYYKDKTGSYVYHTVKFNKDLLTFIVKLDNDAVLYEVDAFRFMTIVSIPLFLILFLFVFRFFHFKITKPILHLTTAAHRISNGDYGTQLQNIQGSQEFSYLSNTFNSMSLKLKYQFEKIYLEELALKDANIKALQSQINPHFLNNTLEIINWEARMMDNYKVSEMIEALSTILSATMNREQQQHITLAEELSYADAYFFIISTRLGERFQVIKDIDESLLKVHVPRLIIQPIIENAVEHGLNEQNQGIVKLHIYSDGDKLYIEVTNQGVLTQKDKAKIDMLLNDDGSYEKECSTSLGIRNVNRRLKIIYGNDCGLTINSNKEGATVSTITVKINKANLDK